MTRATLAIVVMSGLIASAQAPAPIPTSSDVTFDVASVKPNNSGESNSSTSGRAGSFAATNGGPGWINSDRFDINARPPENVKADNPALTRALLRERFKLVAHTETRQEQVYALVVARADGRLGSQIKSSTADCLPSQPGTPSACGMNSSVNETVGRLTGTGQSMENLVTALYAWGP